MLVLVSYDVATTIEDGTRRLRQVAKVCTDYGQRVQYSVFECIVNVSELEVLRNKLLKIVNLETDSLRFYILGNHYKTKVEHYGSKKCIALDEPIIL